MDIEAALQRAIFASLRDTIRPPPQPRDPLIPAARSSPQRTFASDAMLRSRSCHSALERDGILPAIPNPSRNRRSGNQSHATLGTQHTPEERVRFHAAKKVGDRSTPARSSHSTPDRSADAPTPSRALARSGHSTPDRSADAPTPSRAPARSGHSTPDRSADAPPPSRALARSGHSTPDRSADAPPPSRALARSGHSTPDRSADAPPPARAPARSTAKPSDQADSATPLEQRARYEASRDEQPLVELIENEIIEHDLNVHWADVAALQDAKRLLKESVVLPALMPELFVGIRRPPRGMLLFGPPGTGKTMLARALATEAQQKLTFFNVSSATLLSRYLGDSEKLVRLLFKVARHYAPSCIFLDEIDSIASHRGDGEHDAARRVKSELLRQIDGVSSGDERVLVLGATNRPWEIDDAMRRRLEKRVFIGLPDVAARREILRLQLARVQTNDDVALDRLAEASDGYSGADIWSVCVSSEIIHSVVCRDAAMAPLRRALATMEPERLRELSEENDAFLQPEAADFDAAFARIQPSVSGTDSARYIEFQTRFGSL